MQEMERKAYNFSIKTIASAISVNKEENDPELSKQIEELKTIIRDIVYNPGDIRNKLIC